MLPMPRLRIAPQQWTAGIKVSWTPAQLQAAIFTHQEGQFESAAKLSQSMLIDDEYSGALDRAIEYIVGAPLSVVAADDDGEPDAASQDLADQLEPLFYDMLPEAQLGQMVRWYLQLGVAVGTLDWHTEDGVLVPVLRVLNPEFLEFRPDEKNRRGLYGRWVYHTRAGEEEVTPGDGRWILWEDGRDSWVSCGIRALGTTWLGKALTWRDWLRYNERHGMPVVKAMVPAMADDEERAAFVKDASTLGTETTIGLPTHLTDEGAGYDLELLEATDQSWETFQATIERCDRKFQIYFLGSNAGSELTGSQGSRAAAEASGETSKQLASARARRISTFVREQVFAPFAAYNMANVPALPWPQWEIDSGETLAEQAAGLLAMGEAVAAWQAAGYEVSNAETLVSEAGFEIEEGKRKKSPKSPKRSRNRPR